MLPLHDPHAPRHARMFELLRQKELARITAQRLKDEARLEGALDGGKQFQKDALASFNPPPPMPASQSNAGFGSF